MEQIYEFLRNHAQRGECVCGQCIDGGTTQPEGHTADVIFFKVASINSPDADKLKKLIQSNRQGEFNEVDLFDGKEHGYMELGGWVGDQGMALTLMGLGSLLGLWRLKTPRNMLPDMPDDLVMKMAQNGAVIIKKETTGGERPCPSQITD